MRLNRTELKKILYDFNSISNRLMQADFNDYVGVLGKFLKYIDTTPIINDYVVGCGSCDLDVAAEVQEVQTSYGRCIFSTGNTEEEEVRNVYATLHYLVETGNTVYRGVAMGYSTSRNFQDKIKGFNDRFAMVLIRHIERYLTKVGIDMGIDDKVVYNVTVQNGQAIIATDNAMVTATSNIRLDAAQLSALIKNVRDTATDLLEEDSERLADSLEVIEEESKSDKPRKGFVKTAINGLKMLKGTAEFGVAIAELISFLQTVL